MDGDDTTPHLITPYQATLEDPWFLLAKSGFVRRSFFPHIFHDTTFWTDIII